MRVAILCEFSGIVNEAFSLRGHNVTSFDLLPSEKPNVHHIIEDINNIPMYYWREQKFDLAVAFPPCTQLASSAARWYDPVRQQEAINFVKYIRNLPIPRIAIENPVGILPHYIGRYAQIINPYEFGHPETKRTCLWLYNLPRLKPTNIVEGRMCRSYYEPPSPNRWKNRSRTYQGIANAMAEQWGGTI